MASNMLNASSTLYIRIVPCDRERGYMLLVSWVKPVIQKSSVQVISLSVLTREHLDRAIDNVRLSYAPGKLEDVTPVGIHSQLRKLFNEAKTPVAA